MKRVPIVLIVFFVLVLPLACGPAKEGEPCQANKECETGLTCVRNLCIKRVLLPPEDDAGSGADEPTAVDTASPQEKSGDETAQESAPQEQPSVRESQPEPRQEPQSEAITTPDAAPDKATTEPPPERSTVDNAPSGPLTIYEILDPASGKNPADDTPVEIKEAIVTTPQVRLSNTLNVFFVQALQPSNGSYKYGGMMIVYDRQTYPNVAFSLGTIIGIKGTYLVFRSIDWNTTCLLDTDCTKPDYPKCKEVYNTQTSQKEKHCVSATGMPQVELSAAPTSQGNAPVPAPTVVTPAEIRAAPNATPYLGVLVQLNNVVVTSANPDAPKDYSEFSVADPNDKTNDVRVDDLLNTIPYTGSKFCTGCNSSPKKPDDSYCLPGDTCQCKGTNGRCHAGTETQDIRAINDTWQKLIGVLRYANDQFKLLPRIPTDMQ